MAIPIIMIAHRGINIHTNNADDDNEKLRKSSKLIYHLYTNKSNELSLWNNLFDCNTFVMHEKRYIDDS